MDDLELIAPLFTEGGWSEVSTNSTHSGESTSLPSSPTKQPSQTVSSPELSQGETNIQPAPQRILPLFDRLKALKRPAPEAKPVGTNAIQRPLKLTRTEDMVPKSPSQTALLPSQSSQPSTPSKPAPLLTRLAKSQTPQKLPIGQPLSPGAPKPKFPLRTPNRVSPQRLTEPTLPTGNTQDESQHPEQEKERKLPSQTQVSPSQPTPAQLPTEGPQPEPRSTIHVDTQQEQPPTEVQLPVTQTNEQLPPHTPAKDRTQPSQLGSKFRTPTLKNSTKLSPKVLIHKVFTERPDCRP